MEQKNECRGIKEDDKQDSVFNVISLKRRFIEYYLASLITMIYFPIIMRSEIFMPFLMLTTGGFSGLWLFANRSMGCATEIRVGINRITFVFFVLLILNFTHKFEMIAAGISARPDLDQFVLELLRIPVFCVFIYVFAMCHEYLYRTRLFEYVKTKYKHKKKRIALLIFMLVIESLISDIDAAFWPPSRLCTIIILSCFALRLITNKVSNENKALIWSMSFGCYWIFIFDYTNIF